jgi:hypothetical protein
MVLIEDYLRCALESVEVSPIVSDAYFSLGFP